MLEKERRNHLRPTWTMVTMSRKFGLRKRLVRVWQIINWWISSPTMMCFAIALLFLEQPNLQHYFQRKNSKNDDLPEYEACKREGRLLVFTIICPVQHQHLIVYCCYYWLLLLLFLFLLLLLIVIIGPVQYQHIIVYCFSNSCGCN